MVKKDSPIKTIKDLKGRKIGYTNPRSTSQALAILLLRKAGYKEKDAELVKTGGFGPMLAALDLGQIDVAPSPSRCGRRSRTSTACDHRCAKHCRRSTTSSAWRPAKAIRTRGDFIRGVIRARRRAVEFMIENPDEAGDIVAKAFGITRKSRETPCAT